jgi:uncharacterized protein YbjT (DUF2867 family)
MNVLVTGGTGDLGSIVARKLATAGHAVRSASRRPPAHPLPQGVSWARLDLESGEGVDAALEGIDAVIHTASNPMGRLRQTDVEGTRRLLERARVAGVQHAVFVSIVGSDRVPFFYYKVKQEVERLFEQSGVPYTILRATQFPRFFDRLLASQARLPVLFVPTDFKSQPIDPEVVAERLAECIERGPRGLLPDLAGPEVLTLGEIARAWRDARQLRRPIVHLPIPGRAAAGFRGGGLLAPDRPTPGPTLSDWLDRKYGSDPTGRPSPPGEPMWARLAVALIGLGYVAAGMALLLVPLWFYEHIGHFPPFNRHYAGDAGAFSFALGLGLVWAARRLRANRPIIGFATAGSVLHALNHGVDHLAEGASPMHWLLDFGPLVLAAVLLILVLRVRAPGVGTTAAGTASAPWRPATLTPWQDNATAPIAVAGVTPPPVDAAFAERRR